MLFELLAGHPPFAAWNSFAEQLLLESLQGIRVPHANLRQGAAGGNANQCAA